MGQPSILRFWQATYGFSHERAKVTLRYFALSSQSFARRFPPAQRRPLRLSCVESVVHLTRPFWISFEKPLVASLPPKNPFAM